MTRAWKQAAKQHLEEDKTTMDDQHIARDIAEHGQTIIGVFPESGRPQFMYTIDNHERGEGPHNGEIVSLGGRLSVKFLDVSARAKAEYTFQVGFYYDTDVCRVLQLVYPDAEGRFPGEPAVPRALCQPAAAGLTLSIPRENQITICKLKPQLLMDRDGGPSVWLVQHDSEPFWRDGLYRLGCPNCGPENDNAGIVFDVHEVPGYTEYHETVRDILRAVFPDQTPGSFNASQFLDNMAAHLAAKRRHHAEIIARALEAGWYPVPNGDDG
jgi:hypothetical protein